MTEKAEKPGTSLNVIGNYLVEKCKLLRHELLKLPNDPGYEEELGEALDLLHEIESMSSKMWMA